MINNASSFVTLDAPTPDLSPIKQRRVTSGNYSPNNNYGTLQQSYEINQVDIQSQLQHHINKISNKRQLTDKMYAQNAECDRFINQIERINEEKNMESEIAFKQYQGQNPRGLLQEMFREIKGMNYKLNQIVASESEFHQILFPRKLNEIEVLEGSPMYYKISVKDSNSPLKLQFSYRLSD